MPLLPAHVTNALVYTAWISSIPDFTADGVGTELPSDDTTWSANGYVVVPVTVGGTPHSTMPLRRPVAQVECWATIPGSGIPPWGMAEDLAEQIRFATYDRNNFGRLLTISVEDVVYPDAQVRSVKMLTEPRRVYGDQADFAGITFDLALQWIQMGEVVQ
jgi:hypothetical protein